MTRIALIALLLFACGEKKKSGETGKGSGAPVETNQRVTYNNDVPPVLTDANIDALLKAHADHGGITKVADLIGVVDDPAKLQPAEDAIARKVGFKDMKEYDLVSDRVFEIAGEMMAANILKKVETALPENLDPVAFSYSKADVDMVRKHVARLKPMIENAIDSSSKP